MVGTTQFCQITGVQRNTLEAWIEAGWLLPRQGRQGWQFSDLDLVRARLIIDLGGPMGVNDEGIAVILHLVDQVHGLRRALVGVTTPPSTGISSSLDAGLRRSADARRY